MNQIYFDISSEYFKKMHLDLFLIKFDFVFFHFIFLYLPCLKCLPYQRLKNHLLLMVDHRPLK